jgi:phage FluMu protein Com
MIRFACPGCSSTFTVADEKSGKTGKCPKCQIQFTIPHPFEAGSDQPPPMTTSEAPPPIPTVEAPRPQRIRSVEAPPPMPPPVDAEEPVEIAACPKCASRLSVMPGDVGLDVECPNCKTVYRAKRADAPPVLERAMSRPKSSSLVVRQKRDDEDDDRPSRRKKKSRRQDDDDDEEEDDDRPSRPRRKNRRTGRRYDEHRGTLILVFGILGFFVGIFGILAWILGANDLRAMDSGRMDPEGRSNTQTGVLLGKISVILSIVGIIGFCAFYGCVTMAIVGGRPGR